MKNRLKLDFSLQTTKERSNFINEYLPTLGFELSEHESETVADYILWGKNADGQNAQQEGIVRLKEWAPSTNIESIEGLMDVPGFQETRFKGLDATQYKVKREVFNREDVLEKSPPYLQEVYNELFRRIDETELVINFYDLESGKRKTQPRDALLNRFTEEEISRLRARAQRLDSKKYLKLRHYLVELRTEQYIYSDFCINRIMPRQSEEFPIEEIRDVQIGEDILVLPLGLYDNSTLGKKIFGPIDPLGYTDKELRQISDMIWRKIPENKSVINFEDPMHILAMFKILNELKTEKEEDPEEIYGAAASIVRTLQYYRNNARLNDLQKEILHMKLLQKQNLEIATYINAKYGTTYNDNYISTIYRQKILPSIALAATHHRLIMENIFYPENFKKCKDCGQLTLRAPEFFVRQHKAPDGFAPRCKICDKKRRERNKALCQIIVKH